MAPVLRMPKYLHLTAGSSFASLLGMCAWYSSDADPSLSDLHIDEREGKIVVPVWLTSDFHCPWTLIARMSLEEAAKRYPNVVLDIRWNPTFVNSTLPMVGSMDFLQWEQKYFSEPDAHRAQLERNLQAERGKLFGLNINPDKTGVRISQTTNAHRVMYQTYKQKGNAAQDKLAILLYKAYQEDGKDIGSPWVLAEIAQHIGLAKEDVVQYLHTEMDRALVTKYALRSRHDYGNIQAVPQMNFKGKYYPVKGTQHPDVYAEVLRRYDEYLREQLYLRGLAVKM